MPRTGGIYSEPAGTKGTPNTTIQSTPYNAFIDDLVADTNAPRPITAGGTGATTETGAPFSLKSQNLSDLASKPDARLNLTVPVYVADRNALKALDITKDTLAYLKEAGREGIFKWTAGNFSSQITADTQEGVYVKANAVASTAGALVRQFTGPVNPYWYGAVGDDVADDYTPISKALASGFAVHFPKPSVYYKHGTSLAVNGTGKHITCDPGVVFHYTGTVGAAWSLSGTKHDIDIGEILATGAPYCVGYFNLNYSKIKIRTAGQCTAANILHDAGLQTANAGNNEWDIDIIQGGSVPYGIDIQSHATFTLEGETWNVNVIYSNSTASMRLGTTGNNTARWNEYHIAPDGQGITPMLVDVYNDSNFINLRKWAGLAGAPPIAHVRFNAGTASNILISQPGTFGALTVSDVSGNNWALVPGPAGTMKIVGELVIGTDVASTKLHVADNLSGGGNVMLVENLATNNVTTKTIGRVMRGRDTINTGKDVSRELVAPSDGDWVNAQWIQYVRRSDALVPGVWLFGTGSPEGVVTAPVGSLYTRNDGGATTTLYVKTSGTGNTGWTAK